MPLRFHIAEEVTRSPFGVQTRQNLDSSPGALDLTDMLSDVMAVENNPGGSNSYLIPPMLVCGFSANTLRISSR
jgi:hypothetical protein